jgi:hypothetical protein
MSETHICNVPILEFSQLDGLLFHIGAERNRHIIGIHGRLPSTKFGLASKNRGLFNTFVLFGRQSRRERTSLSLELDTSAILYGRVTLPYLNCRRLFSMMFLPRSSISYLRSSPVRPRQQSSRVGSATSSTLDSQPSSPTTWKSRYFGCFRSSWPEMHLT